MTIAKKMYNGATAEDLGLPSAKWTSRMETLQRFLDGSPPLKDFDAEFLAFLKNDRAGKGSVLTKPDPPKIKDMAKSATRAAVDLARGGIAPELVQAERFAICEGCPSLSSATKRLPYQHCKLCGCYMKAKVKIKRIKCPAGKW